MANKITVQGELAKIRQSRHFMVIGMLLLAVAIVWVSVSLLSSQQRTKITPAQQEMAKPLQPTLNTAVIDSLSSEKFYSESELQQFEIYKLFSGQDGSKVVVPIDTPMETLENLNTGSGQEDIEEADESNLFDELSNTQESSASALTEPAGLENSAEPAESSAAAQPTENNSPQ